jgi:uncharacterized protein
MRKEAEIWMTPKQAADPAGWRIAFANFLHIPVGKIRHLRPIQRSIDARTQKVKIRLKAELFIDEKAPEQNNLFLKNYPDVSRKAPVIVVGAGPAGLFAAITLIKNGLRPVIFERGKDVKARKYDIAQLNREHIVNPDSNYCFGEGGAGTYSDGKLYTRSSKRGNVSEILSILVAHGADPDILFDSHPHIGTDRLPAIIQSIRHSILEAGGEIHFNRRVENIIVRQGKVLGIEDKSGERHEGIAVILATGHSAHDIYKVLHRNNVLLEAKSFALGVRAEHPQELIDSIQYHSSSRDPHLPAAIYSLVKQVEGRGVFSFCMCPGGIIVPSATEAGQVVVNGMSNSKRNSHFANSGIVVAIEPEDYAYLSEYGPFAGLEFQRTIEEACWKAGGMRQTAPAQRITDFVASKISSSLPNCSYFPGTQTAPLHEILPPLVTTRLQEAFVLYDKQMKGYMSREAILLGTESRTSSPVRIPRNPDTYEQLQLKRLFPCGEGAGYAGGIVSSAMDGVNCAIALALVCK